MFGGKKERALEEQLQAAREREEEQSDILYRIMEQRDGAQEQFARMTAARAQTEKDLAQLSELIERFGALSEDSEAAASQLHSWTVAMNNAVETFEVNHSVFLKQKKQQDEKIMEVVENNKHFTTPMKYLSEMPSARRDECAAMQRKAQHMVDVSKNMGVLALNAAIEARRMGDVGSKFIATAEGIQNFSEEYEKEANDFLEQLERAETKNRELEEQIHHLNGLLKENNISMTKLMKESMMSTATYESGQLELKTMISDSAVGKADALLKSEQERRQICQQVQKRLESVAEEKKEQKGSADELEHIFKTIQTAVRS